LILIIKVPLTVRLLVLVRRVKVLLRASVIGCSISSRVFSLISLHSETLSVLTLVKRSIHGLKISPFLVRVKLWLFSHRILLIRVHLIERGLAACPTLGPLVVDMQPCETSLIVIILLADRC